MTPADSLSVSAVIPAYNRAHTIERAVRSALRETADGDEVLVVDDGSTDGTGDLIQAMSHNRLRYIRQPNGGAGAARNRGAREAAGDLLAYLDSDDEWLPGKIELQRRFMAANPDALFCFTDFFREFGGKRYGRAIDSWHSDPRSWEQILGPPLALSTLMPLPPGSADCLVHQGDLYRSEMTHNYILTSSIMIRRQQAGNAIHFTEGIKTFEDWECFGRLAARGTAVYIACETAVQHAHPGPRLTDAGLLASAESRMVVLRNVWGSDPGFLAEAGDEYLALMNQQVVSRVRGLLIHGRCREARDEMRRLTFVPPVYRMLARLPGSFVVWILSFRRSIKSLLDSRWKSSKLRDVFHRPYRDDTL